MPRYKHSRRKTIFILALEEYWSSEDADGVSVEELKAFRYKEDAHAAFRDKLGELRAEATTFERADNIWETRVLYWSNVRFVLVEGEGSCGYHSFKKPVSRVYLPPEDPKELLRKRYLVLRKDVEPRPRRSYNHAFQRPIKPKPQSNDLAFAFLTNLIFLAAMKAVEEEDTQ